MNLPSNRALFGLIALAAATSMAIALYLQYQVGLAVCPLCFTQRIFVIAAGGVALIAALHNPKVIGQRIYAALAGLFALIGAGFAGRHVWLQALPEEQAPACGPDLEYMLQPFPFSQTLEVLLMGDGNCAEVVWTFLGLSIPQMTLLLFIAMVIALGTAFVRDR